MNYKLLSVNLLTLIRIIGTVLLIPIYQNFGGIYAGMLALICYLSDSIDGILARKFKVCTFFGAMFDAVADKLFTIINFIVLIMITPYAAIPIIFEVLIVFLQIYKYNNNYNVESNIIGKAKIWILAINIILLYVFSDFNNCYFLSNNIKNILSKIDYIYLLLPAIIIEFITFISYVRSIYKPKENITESRKSIDIPKRDSNSKWVNFKKVWLNSDFYYKHHNETNLKELWKSTKK